MIFGTFVRQPEVLAVEKISSKGLYGAQVAMRGFLRSLLQYGSFEEYYFFTSNSDWETARQEWEEELTAVSHGAHIEVKGLFELGRYLHEKDFTVFHSLNNFLSHPAYVRSRLAKANFPITCRIDTISYHFFLSEIISSLLVDDLQPCDSVICISTAAREAYRQILAQVSDGLTQKHPAVHATYPGRFDVIPLGVDSNTFRPRKKTDARTLLNLPLDALIILCFARFSVHEKMDLLPLLRSFRKVLAECSEQVPNLLLLLVGEDERYNYAKEVQASASKMGIASKVVLRKNVSSIEQPLIYSAADIFISPVDNLQESFGISILEAMSSGIPVVASDWDGYKDTILHANFRH